jgi:catechol 2,3-dioxygenase-like lactoylglutathione lyase family enzyme
MQVAKKLMMVTMTVSDMPTAKEFYADKLGLKVTQDYRQDDDRDQKLGTMVLYFATSDITAAHRQLADKGVKVSDIGDDLHGPGSGTKWFNFKDPDSNLVHIEQE